ncbi:hypothetical protein BC832DRAFT_84461 [Gaertneriomyces semiglobifer]|nr:hypothetical protein BC832DRAFT_84461 [Gaertneriomyces semiglobifer]
MYIRFNPTPISKYIYIYIYICPFYIYEKSVPLCVGCACVCELSRVWSTTVYAVPHHVASSSSRVPQHTPVHVHTKIVPFSFHFVLQRVRVPPTFQNCNVGWETSKPPPIQNNNPRPPQSKYRKVQEKKNICEEIRRRVRKIGFLMLKRCEERYEEEGAGWGER